jgi:hypothetical protein
METFPIFKRKDEQQQGKYRTKRVVPEIYDVMIEAMRARNPCQTLYGGCGHGDRRTTNIPDIYATGDCVETWHHLLQRNTYLPLVFSSNSRRNL